MTGTHNSGKKLLTEMRDLMRRLHYSIHTERAYCDWVERFVRFHHMQTREALFVEAERKAEEYLTYLAVKGKVAASTQNQAFNALIFLYKKVLAQPLEGVKATRSRKEARIPVVLTRDEVKKTLALIDGSTELPVKLLYGCGLRVTEAVRLRILTQTKKKMTAYGLDLIRQDIKPSDILTKKAFENTITVVIAIGGLTNAVLHLLPIAHTAGIELALDDFTRIGDHVPVLADVKPSGRYLMSELMAIGGIRPLMKMLLDAGLLHGKRAS